MTQWEKIIWKKRHLRESLCEERACWEKNIARNEIRALIVKGHYAIRRKFLKPNMETIRVGLNSKNKVRTRLWNPLGNLSAGSTRQCRFSTPYFLYTNTYKTEPQNTIIVGRQSLFQNHFILFRYHFIFRSEVSKFLVVNHD